MKFKAVKFDGLKLKLNCGLKRRVKIDVVLELLNSKRTFIHATTALHRSCRRNEQQLTPK